MKKQFRWGLGFVIFSGLMLFQGCGKSGSQLPTAEDTLAIRDAAMSGSVADLQALLKKSSALASAADNHGMTPLHWAASMDHFAAVELLLACGAEVNAKDKKNRTALMMAADGTRAKSVEVLLAKGAEVNIFVAAGMGMKEKLTAILQANPDAIKAQDDMGRTGLHWAVYHRQSEAVQILLDKGADLAICTREGEAALHSAAEVGSQEFVEKFLQKGAAINEQTKYGKTPLYCAMEAGHDDLSLFLLNRGADIKLADNRGTTALHVAVNRCSLPVVQKILDQGGDYQATTQEGYTLFHSWAMRINAPTDIADLLLRKGLDLNARDHEGRTPLSLALQAQARKNITFLEDHKAKE